jgi:2-iminobutanoate/2-iminopropanoate deaminase
MRQRTRRIGRRGLLLSGAAAGVGALAGGVTGAHAQRAQGPGGIEWLDYDPPRQFAAGARVGNIVYLSGVTGSDPRPGETGAGDITTHSERAFQSIQSGLQAYGSDLQYVFKMTVYLVNMDDQPAFAQVRARVLPRPVASTLVGVTRLVPPNGLIEIDVMAVVPGA